MTKPIKKTRFETDPEGLVVERYIVSVVGYGDGVVVAANRAKALTQTWQSDVFSNMTYGEFLKIAKCVQDRNPPAWFGAPIIADRKAAFYLGRNKQYVKAARFDEEHIGNYHPYDIQPEKFRPEKYRTKNNAPEAPIQPTPEPQKHSLWARLKRYFWRIFLE